MGKRFTEAQILAFLRERKAGVPLRRLCLKHGFSDTAYYRWRAKYGEGASPEQSASLRSEIDRLKHLLADVLCDIEVLKAGRGKAGAAE